MSSKKIAGRFKERNKGGDMTFLDKKGRLFGIINLVDLLVVVVISVLLVSFVSSQVMTFKARQKQGTQATQEEDLLLKVIYYGVENDLAHNEKILRPGDVDYLGKASIEKVLEIRPSKYEADKSEIIVLIRAKCVLSNNNYYCENKIIKMGAPFTFTTARYDFASSREGNGRILDIEFPAR